MTNPVSASGYTTRRRKPLSATARCQTSNSFIAVLVQSYEHTSWSVPVQRAAFRDFSFSTGRHLHECVIITRRVGDVNDDRHTHVPISSRPTINCGHAFQLQIRYHHLSNNVKEMLSSSSVKAAESRVMVTGPTLTQSKMPLTMWSFTSSTVRLHTVPSTLHHSCARAGQEGAELANVLTNATHNGCLECPLHRRSQVSCTDPDSSDVPKYPRRLPGSVVATTAPLPCADT